MLLIATRDVQLTSIVRFHTRPCIRHPLAGGFGSGEAGIAAMAQPYRSKEAGAVPLQGQGHAAMSNTQLALSIFNIELA